MSARHTCAVRASLGAPSRGVTAAARVSNVHTRIVLLAVLPRVTFFGCAPRRAPGTAVLKSPYPAPGCAFFFFFFSCLSLFSLIGCCTPSLPRILPPPNSRRNSSARPFSSTHSRLPRF